MAVKIEGFNQADRVFANLEKSISKKIRARAGRKAAKPIVQQARANISNAQTKTQGNLDGFKHLRALAKLTKVITYKGSVSVQVDPKAPDLPMASKRKEWDAYGVARLFAFGRRKDTGTKTTKGFGDWVEEAGIKLKTLSSNIFKKELENEMQKEFRKVMTKHGHKAKI